MSRTETNLLPLGISAESSLHLVNQLVFHDLPPPMEEVLHHVEEFGVRLVGHAL